MEDKRKEDVKGDNVIEVEELFREYTKISRDEGEEESIKVLKGLSFMIKEQEFVGIMGKSGCGKTTLLKTLGVIDKPTKGKLYFCGKNTRELWSDELADIRRRKIGFVFQDFYLMDSLSVSENIMLPMVLDKKDVKQCVKMSEEYAELFGIMHLMDKYPYELSGGEKQRVAISRALINDPDVILADEPTGNLDSKSGKTVIEALERINKEMKKTIIMVTHDPQVASRCKRILFLKDGVILEDLRRKESAEEFYGKILERMKDL
ncbi:MAG: ABC transporter ATP-binding protein [Dorea sp.]|nr:ABC transporter ATP-binding protein [Dorea sp.]